MFNSKFNSKNNQLNAKVAASRLKEHKDQLLKASKTVFPNIKDDQDLEYAMNIIKKRAKHITYSLPTTKTPKGMGCMSLRYGIHDIWVTKEKNGDISVVFHIDPLQVHQTKLFDRYGNILNSSESKEGE